MDKPGPGLKKIDFNINVIDNEINDMNTKKVVNPSDDLTDDDYNNIKDHENKHKRTIRNNSYYTFVDNKLQLRSQLKVPNKTDAGKLQEIMKAI